MHKNSQIKKHIDIRRENSVREFILVNTILETVVDISEGLVEFIPNDLPRTFIMASIKDKNGNISRISAMAKRFRDTDGYGTSHSKLTKILNEAIIKEGYKLITVDFHGAIMLDSKTKTICLINTDGAQKTPISWDVMISNIRNGVLELRGWNIECYANDRFDFHSKRRATLAKHCSII